MLCTMLPSRWVSKSHWCPFNPLPSPFLPVLVLCALCACAPPLQRTGPTQPLLLRGCMLVA